MRSGSRWLTAEVLAMAPRLPVRDQQRLRAQFPGLGPEELADALIHGACRAAAVVGAGAGAAMVLPLPTAPVEIAVETLALVGIEIKLVAELHEVYGMRAPGSTPSACWPTSRPGRTAAAWPSRPPGWCWRRAPRCAGGCSAGSSPGPRAAPFARAAAHRRHRGRGVNRRETRHLGDDVRDDLRRRSPYAANWAR